MTPGNLVKILVVDNSESTCDCMKSLYSENGYECLRMKDGTLRDLDLAKYIPELIIVDMALPRVNAPEALSALRNNEKLKDVPILMISRHGTPRDKLMGYACGANSFITKPIEKKALLNEIARMIKHSETASRL